MIDDDVRAIASSGSHMNWLARAGLNGESVSTPSRIVGLLIDLLESEHELERETRELLADALKRGQFGNRIEAKLPDGAPVPRLVLEGLGRTGRVSEAVLARRKWLDAAEELDRVRVEEGRKGYEALQVAGERFGLGIDAMKKAVKFRNRFEKALCAEDGELVGAALAALSATGFDVEDENHFYIARAIFIERDAEACTK